MVLAAEPPEISVPGPMAGYSSSARSLSMSAIEPSDQVVVVEEGVVFVAQHVDQGVADADDVQLELAHDRPG